MAPKCKNSDAGHSDMPERSVNFTVGMCVQEKAENMKIRHHLGFWAHTGGLRTHPPQMRGDYSSFKLLRDIFF